MPTRSLLPFLNLPDGLDQIQNLQLSGAASFLAPDGRAACQPAAARLPAAASCLLCERSFALPEQLRLHVLSEHPTSVSEAAVLVVDTEFGPSGHHGDRVEEEGEELRRCIVCSHTWRDAAELESHMRKHKEYFAHLCGVCGRRFRESWFLKNHMKMHSKTAGKTRAQQDLEAPPTVNGVALEAESEPPPSAYRMCMVCGFFFPNHDSLAQHSKGHNREAEPSEAEAPPRSQATFLRDLGLRPAAPGEAALRRTSKWIPELNPFVTYQAWQLATRGKVAVGPNTAKEPGGGADGSTDGEGSGSDRDEQGGVPEALGDNTETRVGGKERQTQNPPRRSLIQNQDRPTRCQDCGRSFKTYHQLVLHSRVHKRDRGGEDAPPPAAAVEEQEEAGLEDALTSGDDGSERTKTRSRSCSYCGKTFRSSYYLTIHLRTHTGEKPYKCEHCPYAAAQKTSLKYHVYRHHKDRPSRAPPTSSPSPSPSPTPSSPSPQDQPGSQDKNTSINRSKLSSGPAGGGLDGGPMVVPADGGPMVVPADGGPMVVPADGGPMVVPADGGPMVVPADGGRMVSASEGRIEVPAPVLALESLEVQKDSEAPLNLSVRVSVSIRPRGPDIGPPPAPPLTCSRCSYSSSYPEVLLIHERLTHRDGTDGTKKIRLGADVKLRRLTGCPPALDGRDVPPLRLDCRHPRRTKSPEKSSAPPPPGPRRAPSAEPCRRPTADPKGPESSRHPELHHRPNMASAYAVDRKSHVDRVGVNDRGHPDRGGPLWPPDATRLCFSSPRGGLAQMDFAEPSGKRRWFSEVSEHSVFGGRGRAMMAAGQGMRTVVPGPRPPGPRPPPGPEAVGPLKSSRPVGAGLDPDWGMMTLLRSYTAADLVALYHSAPPDPGRGAPPLQRSGARSVLYHRLPGLPGLPGLPPLQRRAPPASAPPTSAPRQRYGDADQNA